MIPNKCLQKGGVTQRRHLIINNFRSIENDDDESLWIAEDASLSWTSSSLHFVAIAEQVSYSVEQAGFKWGKFSVLMSHDVRCDGPKLFLVRSFFMDCMKLHSGIIIRNCVQGGPSDSGTHFVDVKFKFLPKYEILIHVSLNYNYHLNVNNRLPLTGCPCKYHVSTLAVENIKLF